MLQLKSQGFPDVLKLLGVQSPLSGPFWGFEPTILPIYIIGSESQQHTATFFSSRFNHQDSVTSNPGASAFLLDSPAMSAGRHVIHLWWSFFNASANASTVVFKTRDSGGTVINTIPITVVGATGNNMDHTRGETEICEELEEGDDFILENLSALATASFRAAWKWERLGPVLSRNF